MTYEEAKQITRGWRGSVDLAAELQNVVNTALSEASVRIEQLEAVERAARALGALSLEGPTVEKYSAARALDDALGRVRAPAP
jgi:hypothetical protein